MTVFTSFFQGGLDEAEKIEPAPIEYTDLNQGNLSYLLFKKCIANLFFFYNIGPYSLFDNSSSVTLLEMDKPSKDC